MALLINELCVNCDVCAPVCPNTAISMGAEIYEIDPARCTECVGHFPEPQCVEVCPVECIDPDPAYPESQDDLLRKLAALGTAPDAPDAVEARAAEPDAGEAA
ncbi:MAG: YfhL family 4Fe-4S dicluster ferredoxin [Lysobacteraceae bacterium]